MQNHSLAVIPQTTQKIWFKYIMYLSSLQTLQTVFIFLFFSFPQLMNQWLREGWLPHGETSLTSQMTSKHLTMPTKKIIEEKKKKLEWWVKHSGLRNGLRFLCVCVLIWAYSCSEGFKATNTVPKIRKSVTLLSQVYCYTGYLYWI